MNQLLASLKRAFKQPAFVVVAAILVIAAAGLNAATELLNLHFRKLPVPLSRELGEVPNRLGPWRQVSIDVPFPPEIEKVLGTKQYISRYYVDTRIVPDKDLDEIFKGKSPKQCEELALALQNKSDRACVQLMLTYYTGMIDTVAHVPERCMTASGFEATHRETIPCGPLKDRPGDQSMRFITFEDTRVANQSSGMPAQLAAPQKVVSNFTYFFNCNGEYTSDSIGVRTRLANLFQTYGYYMKIETHVYKSDAGTAASLSRDLLAAAMPEIEKCLPDWNKYSGKKAE